SLPVPPQGQALIEAVRASLRILPLMPKRIAYSAYSGLWRAPLGEVDCSLFLYGKTGKGKSEWAALHQQHFGPEMDRLHLPGNFSSTGNSLEYQAFLIK